MLAGSITLFLVGVVVYLFAACIALLAKYYDPQAPGLISWAVGLLMASFSSFLLFSNHGGPHPALLLTAGSLIVASFMSMWASLRRYRLRKPPLVLDFALVAAAAGAFLMTVLAASRLWPLTASYAVVYGFFGLGLNALLAGEAWVQRDFAGVGQRRIAAWAFTVIAFSFFLRLAAVALVFEHVIADHTGAGLINFARYVTTAAVLLATFSLAFTSIAGASWQGSRPTARSMPNTR